MKKLLFITATLSVIFFSSCSDENESSSGLVDQLDLEAEAALESNYEDVDELIDAGMENLEIGGRMERHAKLECATITKDTVNKVLTIDYGDGCEGPYGRVRKGKIIIQYNERRLIPGAYRIATLEDFFIDDVQVEGTRTLENISVDLNDNPTFSVKLEGGKLTFDDETTATREVDHIRTWIRAANPLNDEVTVTGTANGSKRDGVEYSVTILETIVWSRACRGDRVFIPVSGVKEVVVDGVTALVDYGDGTCDNEVVITIDSESFTRTIEPRGKRS